MIQLLQILRILCLNTMDIGSGRSIIREQHILTHQPDSYQYFVFLQIQNILIVLEYRNNGLCLDRLPQGAAFHCHGRLHPAQAASEDAP